MKNFRKKTEYLNTLFIYKFKLYDRLDGKYKIYYFSPDDLNTYLSVNQINSDTGYFCEYGDLIYTNNSLEFKPKEYFEISNKDYLWFKKIHDGLPLWSSNKINEIFESFKKIDTNLF